MTLPRGSWAIVLGGSSGIGLAATNQLASEGATVIAASRQPQRARGEVRAGVDFQVCDVQDREALCALFAASAPFDILVNAATGGPRAMGPFLQMDLDGYRGSFAKLWGYTNSVRLAAEHMDERGTIVLVSGTRHDVRSPDRCRWRLWGVPLKPFAAPWLPNWHPDASMSCLQALSTPLCLVTTWTYVSSCCPVPLPTIRFRVQVRQMKWHRQSCF